eukprot:gene4266-biopygen5386
MGKLFFRTPCTKLSGRKIWPYGPARTESIVPGSREKRRCPRPVRVCYFEFYRAARVRFRFLPRSMRTARGT